MDGFGRESWSGGNGCSPGERGPLDPGGLPHRPPGGEASRGYVDLVYTGRVTGGRRVYRDEAHAD